SCLLDRRKYDCFQFVLTDRSIEIGGDNCALEGHRATTKVFFCLEQMITALRLDRWERPVGGGFSAWISAACAHLDFARVGRFDERTAYFDVQLNDRLQILTSAVLYDGKAADPKGLENFFPHLRPDEPFIQNPVEFHDLASAPLRLGLHSDRVVLRFVHG